MRSYQTNALQVFSILLATTLSASTFTDDLSSTVTSLTMDEFEETKPLETVAGSSPHLLPEIFRNRPTRLDEAFPQLKAVPAEQRMDVFNHIVGNVYPERISYVIGVNWKLTNSLPTAVIRAEATKGGFPEVTPLAIVSLLNIDLDSPDIEMNLPHSMNLEVKLVSNLNPVTKKVLVYTFSIRVSERELGDGRYYIQNPSAALYAIEKSHQEMWEAELQIPSALRERGRAYPRAPELALTGLLVDDPAWLESIPKTGKLLIHHVLLGDFRLTTGWQWAGRLPDMPGTQQRGFVTTVIDPADSQESRATY